MTFNYEASGTDYALVIGDGNSIKSSITLNMANTPTPTAFSFLASENGNSWFGIEKNNDKNSDLVLDDLVIIEK